MSNTKDIKDYLHLYGLGLEVMFDNKTWIIEYLKERVVRLRRKEGAYHRWVECFYDELIIPLRQLSDITEQEAREYAVCYLSYITDDVPVKIEPDEYGYIKVEVGSKEHGASLFPGRPHGDRPEAFRYLLSKGFDLFGLIEAGLALIKQKAE